jgi:TetR/AcrR family transcriptional regulator, tetracycline repressor protein
MEPVSSVAPRGRGRRRLDEGPALDLERLIETLLQVARAEGLGALNMRRVAAELDVSPRLLYRHVRDKEEMISILGDAITARNMPDLSPADWETRLRNIAKATRAAFADFPGVPATILAHAVNMPNRPHALRVRQGVLQALRDAGLSQEHVEISFVQFAVILLGSLVLIENLAADSESLAIDRARVEHSIDLGLDLLIFGIKQLAAKQTA